MPNSAQKVRPNNSENDSLFVCPVSDAMGHRSAETSVPLIAHNPRRKSDVSEQRLTTSTKSEESYSE